VLAAPGLSIVGFDFHLRWSHVVFTPGAWVAYVTTALLGAALWAALLVTAAGQGKRAVACAALFLALFTLALGEQRYFFFQYGAYLDEGASRFAVGFGESIVNQIAADLSAWLAAKGLPLVVALGLVLAARRALRPLARRFPRAPLWLPLALVLVCFLPLRAGATQCAPPDLLFFNAFGELALVRLGLEAPLARGPAEKRTSSDLPPLASKPSAARNIAVILLESVRADATCRVPGGPCRETPYSDALTRERYPLLQLRALDSATLVSLGVLWTGLGPQEDERTVATHPLLFDYARAAGWDSAYFTSQNARFGTLGNWIDGLAASKVVTARDLEANPDLDLGAREDLLADRVCDELPKLREPYFVFIQLAGTHYPFRVEASGPQPFQPSRRSKAPEDNAAFFNTYRNSVHQQDQHVAQLIRCLRRGAAGQRTVLFLTSDHGEAFREHHQLGHTLSIYDEEIHVPGWVDAPAGTLTPAEQQHLRAKQHVPTFHVDLTATVLDLMGVWTEPGLLRFRKRMLGTSWLEAEHNTRALPITNCTALWGCAFENWGLQQGFLKLEARAWDPDWHCFDLARDPGEKRDLGPRACAGLAERAIELYGRRPGQSPAR
jgi:glucan phosphoethanolaminetransferase (alkaline phosphatase superfamily)